MDKEKKKFIISDRVTPLLEKMMISQRFLSKHGKSGILTET